MDDKNKLQIHLISLNISILDRRIILKKISSDSVLINNRPIPKTEKYSYLKGVNIDGRISSLTCMEIHIFSPYIQKLVLLLGQ